jgi:hypothetical protein
MLEGEAARDLKFQQMVYQPRVKVPCTGKKEMEANGRWPIEAEINLWLMHGQQESRPPSCNQGTECFQQS